MLGRVAASTVASQLQALEQMRELCLQQKSPSTSQTG